MPTHTTRDDLIEILTHILLSDAESPSAEILGYRLAEGLTALSMAHPADGDVFSLACAAREFVTPTPDPNRVISDARTCAGSVLNCIRAVHEEMSESDGMRACARSYCFDDGEIDLLMRAADLLDAQERVMPHPEPNQDPQPDFSSTLVDDAVLTSGAMLDHLCCAEGMSTPDALRACAEFKDQSGRAVKTELTDSDRALFLLAADILDAQNEMDYWACRVRFVGDIPRVQAQTEV